MIEVKHLDKSFGDLHILKDISTNIEKGEKVVIIGPSGSCLLYTSPSPRD